MIDCKKCVHYELCLDFICSKQDMERDTDCDYFEEPRPHGEWINEDYGIGLCFAECSECGEETEGFAKENGFGFDYSFPNYCPNCGAKMTGER